MKGLAVGKMAQAIFWGMGSGLSFAVMQFIALGLADWISKDDNVQPICSMIMLFNFINAPAEWLSSIWTHDLNFPPHGEIAWLLVPAVAISIQWGIIGILIGIFVQFRRKSS